MKNCNINEQQTTRGILRIACVTALAIAVTAALPHAARAQGVTPPVVPGNIEVEAPNQAFLLGHGVGTQNYMCAPAATLGRVAWKLFTPQATLFSDAQEQLTTHFFSLNPEEPGIVRVTWQDSKDTSTVWGRVIEISTDASFVNPNAIAWLKVEAVGAQVGPTGGRTLSGTTFIQRVNTEGGLAPATGCDQLKDVGKTAFVPYTADYVFYKK